MCLAGGTAWAGIKTIELDTSWSPDAITVYCERHQGILWGIDDSDAFGRYGCLTDEHAVECDADGNCIKVYDEETEQAAVTTRPTSVA